jgi:hypothetical protein
VPSVVSAVKSGAVSPSDDVYAICELPDDETAAAVSMRITASGSVTVDTVKLLTPEQIDTAIDRSSSTASPASDAADGAACTSFRMPAGRRVTA